MSDHQWSLTWPFDPDAQVPEMSQEQVESSILESVEWYVAWWQSGGVHEPHAVSWRAAPAASPISSTPIHGISWRGWTNCFYDFLHVSTVLVILVLFSFGFFWDLRDSQKCAGKFPTSRSGEDDGGDGQQPGDVPRPGSALSNAVNVNTYKLFFRLFKYMLVICCIFLRWSHLLQLFHAPGIRQLCLGWRKVMLRKQAWLSSHEYICGCSFCSFTHTERDTATKPFCDRIVWTLNFNMK
jgi:hypothetical protein